MDRYTPSMKVQVTTYHLEMNQPDELHPKEAAVDGFRIERVCTPSPELNRFLYVTVGYQWEWTDRLVWGTRDWTDWVDRDELKTSVAYVKGSPAGYFELELQAEGNVEIAFFGLFRRFIGLGLGGHLLTEATRGAWNMGAGRVWVHTCTLDHPHALENYQARGFTIFHKETRERDIRAVNSP